MQMSNVGLMIDSYNVKGGDLFNLFPASILGQCKSYYSTSAKVFIRYPF